MVTIKRYAGAEPLPEGSKKRSEITTEPLLLGELAEYKSLEEVDRHYVDSGYFIRAFRGCDVVLASCNDWRNLIIFIREGRTYYYRENTACFCTGCIDLPVGRLVTVAQMRKMLNDGLWGKLYTDGIEEEINAVLDMLSSLGYP